MNKLAIKSGKPVRIEPLPQEWCGAHFIDEKELAAVSRVIKSRSLFRYYGFDLQNEVSKLEKEFASYIGSKHAIAVSSGTGALQVALGALGVGPGDEIILPGYFWVATVGAVVRSGAIPVLVDSDDTFSLDPSKVEAKITPRTKAIIIVHMGGVIGHIKELVKVARKHNLKVLEDCAQATGASQAGIKAGAFGDIGIYSFQFNKNITSGEGGMIVCNDTKLYNRAFAIHDLGYPRNDAGRLVFDNKETQLWGVGCRMSELTGAVARVQLNKLDRICKNMRTAKNLIKDKIDGIKGITASKVIDPDGDSGNFLLLTFDNRKMSLDFVGRLRAEGIVSDKNGMYPIHMDDWGLHIYYNIPSLVKKRGLSAKSVWDLQENANAKVSYDKGTCPHLDSLLCRTALICIASNLKRKDINDIITAIKKVMTQIQEKLS
ncbi:MAG: DegT/DnrJ/EryC1/StrS family aminotransferase [Victivallaceae bacterium]